ncbi:uncharacterized protein G2W53_036970 [Senna tora]|uniref:Uncharacterized protein n=1 Tax=Senna tora TaxID=362788 RepID=A0A834SYD5_9FABA|nr:uncharacterized protein G2W53_036970 [Senna tora]
MNHVRVSVRAMRGMGPMRWRGEEVECGETVSRVTTMWMVI